MKKQLLTGSILSLLLPLFAYGQCNPATALAGQTWAYHIDHPYSAAIGVFTANAGGTLSMMQTSTTVLGDVQRMAPGSGRWMSNDTCTGGMLLLNINRRAYQLNYTITPGDPASMTFSGRDDTLANGFLPVPVQSPEILGCVGNQPALVQINCMGPGPVGRLSVDDLLRVYGGARLNPPKSCPSHITNPLGVLNGAAFNYRLSQGSFLNGLVEAGLSETGRMDLSFPNPFAYSGNLSISNRMFSYPLPDGTLISPFPMARYPEPGRYIIYSDCSGGEFLINGNTLPIHLEFVFSKADFSEVYMLLDYVGFPDSSPTPYFGTGVRP